MHGRQIGQVTERACTRLLDLETADICVQHDAAIDNGRVERRPVCQADLNSDTCQTFLAAEGHHDYDARVSYGMARHGTRHVRIRKTRKTAFFWMNSNSILANEHSHRPLEVDTSGDDEVDMPTRALRTLSMWLYGSDTHVKLNSPCHGAEVCGKASATAAGSR